MSEIVLSRIATCYRQWNFVEQWIRDPGLFAPGTEWFIVNDDPAHPPPPHVAAELRDRGIQVLTPRANLGRSRARNFAAAQAKGTWLDFIDGDDRPLPFDTASLSGIGADLICLPVRLADADTLPFHDAPQAPLDSASTWDDLLPRFAPVNVMPSAILWRRTGFLALNGYDSRFDGAEDLHLVFSAMQAGYSLARLAVPKQTYFLRGTRRTFEIVHIYSHRRALQQLFREAQDPTVRSAAERWFGKYAGYEAAVAPLLFWQHRGAIWKYVKFRLRTLLG